MGKEFHSSGLPLQRNKQNESIVNSNHSNASYEQADIQNCPPVSSRIRNAFVAKNPKLMVVSKDINLIG